MPKIVLVAINQNPISKIPQSFIESLKKLLPLSCEVSIISESSKLMKGLIDVDYIISYPIPKTYIKRNKNLKGIFFLSSQVSESFKNQSFRVWDIKGLNSEFVANHVSKFSAQAKTKPTEHTIGVIGTGEIGARVAKEHLTRGFSVQYVARQCKTDLGAFYSFEEYDKFLQTSDVIIVCTSLNSETQKLFTHEQFFKKIKPTIKLINIARGELFLEEDLVSFFKENSSASYFTDVVYPEPYPESGKLRDLDNVVITNHIAGFDEKLWPKIEKKLESTLKEWRLDEN